MLDNCIQGCFVKSSFVKNLKIKRHKTSVSVKTFIGEKTHTSFAVDGLKVLSGSISQRLIFQLIPAKLPRQRR